MPYEGAAPKPPGWCWWKGLCWRHGHGMLCLQVQEHRGLHVGYVTGYGLGWGEARHGCVKGDNSLWAALWASLGVAWGV